MHLGYYSKRKRLATSAMRLHVLATFSWAAPVVGNANLLTFVDGGLGNLLGTPFGAPGSNASFDYVIVGGGTAGLTMATRLASAPGISVAVIEAGVSTKSITVTKAPSRDTQTIIRDLILTTTNHLSTGVFQLFPKQRYALSCNLNIWHRANVR